MIDLSIVHAILNRYAPSPSSLMSILNEVQQEYRYLPPEAIETVADYVGQHVARIESVASFYSGFRFTPAGTHTIKVCFGTACFVKGAELVYEAFRSELKIAEGDDTDKARLFSIEQAACLGCCMLAPAVQIGDTIFGHVGRERVPSVLSDFLSSLSTASDDSPLPGTGGEGGEIRMCTCTSCAAAGARTVYGEIVDQVKRNGSTVPVRRSGCSGISYRAPLVEVRGRLGGVTRYGNVAAGAGPVIVDTHFPKRSLFSRVRRTGSRIADAVMDAGDDMPVVRFGTDIRDSPDGMYVDSQKRIVTEGYERCDPLDIVEYQRLGGFTALIRAAEDPEWAIGTIERSGLRGRGGGGYVSSAKWRAVADRESKKKYAICNADEGDPGAFMDRMILESFPFRVIEGLLTACIAVGAPEGVFYVRHEYPLAISRLEKAIALVRSSELLSGIEIPALTVVKGAGAFVCGEETALIAAIEGHRGNPRPRPPYPSSRGLHGCPTLVNNVETLATVPWILRNGDESFRSIGSPDSPGTKTFALAGRIVRGGLIEVPMGISIREIVEEIGGGVGEGRQVKAVQIGGPSGGCIPERLFDLPVDFGSLSEVGAMMGSGGMVVLDDTDCMVSVSRYFMSFTERESCGKCGPCRVGTKRMMEILDRLCSGRGSLEELNLLEESGRAVAAGSFCNLGKTAPNPVLTSLRYFREEFEAHVHGRCPAGVCREMISYTISDACIGCTRCAQSCPVSVITGVPYERHTIDQDHCIRCGTCHNVCPADAVEVS